MTAAKPLCCPICGLYFTTHIYFYGRRCLQPDHWLAAGLLTPADYIPLSQLAALAAVETGGNRSRTEVNMRRFAPNSPSNSICVLISLVGAVLIGLGVLMIVSPEPVLARTNDLTAAVSRYPQIDNTDLDSCTLCHGSSYSLNAYGLDYDTYGFATTENIDSDNDGFVNVDEIELFFYPGNSADHPEDFDLVMALYSDLPEIESHACHLCHTDESSPDLNPYGADYLSHGRTRAALVAIENLDSDGDGYCNLDELELGYCPGEPECPTHSESLLLQYPNVEGTRLESCDFCHHTGDAGWPLNSYGLDYNNAGSNRTAFAIIETLDSDGDGYLNIEEIQALNMPGDPMDSPAQNNDMSVVFLPIILN